MKKVKRKRKRIARKNRRRARNLKKIRWKKRKRRKKRRVDLPLSPKAIKNRLTTNLQMKTTKRLRR